MRTVWRLSQNEWINSQHSTMFVCKAKIVNGWELPLRSSSVTFGFCCVLLRKARAWIFFRLTTSNAAFAHMPCRLFESGQNTWDSMLRQVVFRWESDNCQGEVLNMVYLVHQMELFLYLLLLRISRTYPFGKEPIESIWKEEGNIKKVKRQTFSPSQ